MKFAEIGGGGEGGGQNPRIVGAVEGLDVETKLFCMYA